MFLQQPALDWRSLVDTFQSAANPRAQLRAQRICVFIRSALCFRAGLHCLALCRCVPSHRQHKQQQTVANCNLIPAKICNTKALKWGVASSCLPAVSSSHCTSAGPLLRLSPGRLAGLGPQQAGRVTGGNNLQYDRISLQFQQTERPTLYLPLYLCLCLGFFFFLFN